LKVRDYFVDEIHTIDLNQNYTVLEVSKMFLDKDIDSVIIIKDNKPIYILTQTDLIFFFFKGYEDKTIKEIIELFPKKILTIDVDAEIYEAYKIMRSTNIEHLIVVDKDQKVIGELHSKHLISKFVQIAVKDEMTGLYNQRFLETIKSRYAKSNTKVGVIFIDIDNFKYYNDTFGHDVGDEVIKTVAECIKSSIRELDFAFRYGGDEFLVFIINQNKDVLLKIANRIFNKINSIENEKFGKISVSIGIALYPDDSKNLDEVIKMADKNLYIAKTSGKGQIINN
jgi:diguanylate cyclase (GGDEF)-like protein